jgi:hypothetical protein
MLHHHWLASQEGFSIRRLQVFRTCLNSDKNQSANVGKSFPICFLKFEKKKLKNENILTDCFLFIFYFSHFDRISHHKEGWFSLYYNCDYKELSELIKQVQMLGKSPKLECFFFWGEFLQPDKKKKEGAKDTKGVFFFCFVLW